jgi:hypothetical protein
VLNADLQKDQGVTLGTPTVLVQPAATQLSQGGGLLSSDGNHAEC